MVSVSLQLIITAFAVSALSLTLTRSTLAMAAKDWAGERLPLLEKLLGCPYCTSHWISFAVAAFMELHLTGVWLLDYLIGVFCLVGMAAVISGVIFHLVLYPESEIERLRGKLIELRDYIKREEQ